MKIDAGEASSGVDSQNDDRGRKLAIWKNNVFSTESGIRALADSAVELVIVENRFQAIPTYSLAFPNCLSVKTYIIANNVFMDEIPIKGKIVSVLIKNCGLNFCNKNGTMKPNFYWKPPALTPEIFKLKTTKEGCVIQGYPQHVCMMKKI